MSLKKDNFSSAEKKYMKLAINLANQNTGFTGPNPSVGCVVVKNKEIVSFGVTNINGRPHAEAVALNKNKNLLKKSDIYITLEPCSHYGKTPPCTNKITRSRIRKVTYSINDSDSRSSNKSKKILNSKNIIVKSGLMKNKVKQLYKKYIFSKKNNLPYVVGKLACSSNYFIFNNKGYISNNFSRKVAHLLRSKHQAILTSYKTINQDNPKLNCRISGLEKFSPIRIILDKNLKLKINTFVINTSKMTKTYIYHNSNNQKKLNKLKKKGVILIKKKANNNNNFDILTILKDIYKKGIQSLLIEAGMLLTQQMLNENFVNEFYLFKSNKIINSKNKINVLGIKSILNTKYKNKKIINRYLKNDQLIHYS